MAKLTKKATERLRPYERTPSGRIKNYYDPETRNVWSARQYRQARSGTTGEQVTAIRKAAPEAAKQIRKKLAVQGESVKHLIHAYQERERQETGKRRSQTEILSDPDFWQSADALTADRSKGAKGKKAKALENFGLRPRNAPWKVGESPKRRRR